MKKIIICILCLVTSSITLASGTRSLDLNFNLITNLPEVELSDFNRKINYLGSTNQWHFLAETLTSAEGGMPYSNTYGYKIAKEKIKIHNGWFLDLDELNYQLYVPNCPAIYIKKALSTLQATIKKNSKDRCIIYSTTRSKE